MCSKDSVSNCKVISIHYRKTKIFTIYISNFLLLFVGKYRGNQFPLVFVHFFKKCNVITAESAGESSQIGRRQAHFHSTNCFKLFFKHFGFKEIQNTFSEFSFPFKFICLVREIQSICF